VASCAPEPSDRNAPRDSDVQRGVGERHAPEEPDPRIEQMHLARTTAVNAIVSGEFDTAYDAFSEAHGYALAMASWSDAVAIADAVIELADTAVRRVSNEREQRLRAIARAEGRTERVARRKNAAAPPTEASKWEQRRATWRATRAFALKQSDSIRVARAPEIGRGR